MATIQELLARAAALREETAINSISPERAGGIMYDTIMAINELWLQQGSALVISKIYTSVASMEADDEPVSDISGQPLRAGQIVVIASSDSDNGSVYRFGGISEGASVWALVGAIGGVPCVDSLDSDSTTLPLAAHQGKVLDGKISELSQKTEELVGQMSEISQFKVVAQSSLSEIQGAYLNAGAKKISSISGNAKVYYYPVNKGKTYKVDSDVVWDSGKDSVAFTPNPPAIDAAYTVSLINAAEASSQILFTPDENGYLLLQYRASAYSHVYTQVNLSDELFTRMIALREYSVSGNVVYDSNEIPQSYDITWADGTSGTVVLSAFNLDVFEYSTITATYEDKTIVYTLTYDINGYIINETYNIQ